MAQANVTQSNFLGGEFSPSAQGRIDLPQYREALALCRNAIPSETGAVVRRSGTKFIQPTMNGTAAANFAIRPGDYAGYVVEMTNDGTNTHFRYLHGGHLVTDGTATITDISTSNPAQITISPSQSWATSDKALIQIVAQAGVDKSIWSPLVNRTLQLTRVDGTNYTLTDALTGASIDGSAFTGIPTGSKVGRIKIDTPAVLANANLPVVKAVQTNNEVIVFALVNGTAVQPQVLSLSAAQTSTTFATFTLSNLVMADGPYNAIMNDTMTITSLGGNSYTVTAATGPFTVTESVGDPFRINLQPPQWVSGTDYTTATNVVSDVNGNQWTNINASGSNSGHDPRTSPNYWAPYANGSVWVWGTITAVASTTSATITILEIPVTLGTSANTYGPVAFQVAYFSNQGTSLWPTCGSFYEGRLFCGDANNAVNATISAGLSGSTATFSPTDQYGNVLDSSGIQETILGPGTNTIWWMLPDSNGILFGTDVSEWFIQATTLGNPITPTSFQAHQFTKYGSTFIQPVRMGIAMAFINRFSARLFEYMTDPFGSRFSGRPLNLWSKGIVNGLAQLEYQDQPEPIIWTNAGTLSGLASCTYRRISFFVTEQPAFYAWAGHQLGTGFTFKAMCNSTSSDDQFDQLYIITNNNGLYYHEMLMPLWQDNNTLVQAWPLDACMSGINYGTLQSGTDTGPIRFEGLYAIDDGNGNLWINGLHYFAGKTVTAWLGGLDCGDYVVSAGGTITVPYGADAGGLCTQAYLLSLDKVNLPPPATAWYREADLPNMPTLIGGTVYNIPMVVGTAFTTVIQKLRPDAQQDAHTQLGPATGTIKRNHWYALNLSAGVANTIQIGGDNLVTYPASLDNYKTGQPTPATTLFQGIFRDTVDSDYDLDGQLYIKLTRPAPMSLASWTGMVESNEI